MTQPQQTQENRFHPTAEDFGDLRARVQEKLTVPVVRHPVQPRNYSDLEESPFEVTAAKLVLQYPFTREKFEELMEALVQDFADFFNHEGQFDAYPIVSDPRWTEFVSCLDYRGPEYPFDLRMVLMFENSYNAGTEEDPVLVPVVKFFLSTLTLKR